MSALYVIWVSDNKQYSSSSLPSFPLTDICWDTLYFCKRLVCKSQEICTSPLRGQRSGVLFRTNLLSVNFMVIQVKRDGRARPTPPTPLRKKHCLITNSKLMRWWGDTSRHGNMEAAGAGNKKKKKKNNQTWKFLWKKQAETHRKRVQNLLLKCRQARHLILWWLSVQQQVSRWRWRSLNARCVERKHSSFKSGFKVSFSFKSLDYSDGKMIFMTKIFSGPSFF